MANALLNPAKQFNIFILRRIREFWVFVRRLLLQFRVRFVIQVWVFHQTVDASTGKVETMSLELRLEKRNDSNVLRICAKSTEFGHLRIKEVLTGLTKGRVPDVVG